MPVVPFFRPDITENEIDAVVGVLRSGWLTTGPITARFEREFAEAVGARHALAVNSCTAALHLAVHALGLTRGDRVLVPTMTFAATAEVVRYAGAVPVLIDCDEVGNLDLTAAARALERDGAWRGGDGRIVGVMPVHVGGHMIDLAALESLARRWQLWVVEDAAHAFPAAWRPADTAVWRRCGESTAAVTCFSFYANKTITTGEGGMATTHDADLAARMRRLALHGLSHDAWSRYRAGASWDYRIVEAGFKYNLTDIAAAIGVHQLARAEAMRAARQAIAERYHEALQDIDEIVVPPAPSDRLHAWHLYAIELRLDRLRITRDAFIEALVERGVSPSVHWRPLHMHPYYAETFGYRPDDCPNAAARFARVVSLPIFSSMTDAEIVAVVDAVSAIVACHRRTNVRGRAGRPASPTGVGI
jgi:dTDP-4-amino-4,6-dideoxygalactose transaminase